MNADDYRDKADLAKAERKPDVLMSVPMPPPPKQCPACGVSWEATHSDWCPFRLDAA